MSWYKRASIILLVIIMVTSLSCVCRRPHVNNNTDNTEKPDVSINPDAPASSWIYPESDDANPVWGIKNGIAFGAQQDRKPPKMDEAPAGTWAPGLLYVMWTDDKGRTHFFNYIGFSMINLKGLEQSEPQKIEFSPENISYLDKLKTLHQQYGEDSAQYQDYVNLLNTPATPLSQTTSIQGDIMSVVFRLSPFEKNDTSVYIMVSIDKNKPTEMSISAQNMFPDTRPVKFIHVSATAGSIARLRDLYLKDGIVNSRDLFRDMKPGIGCFYMVKTFDLDRLPVDSQGTITVYAGNDEPGEWMGEFNSKAAPFYGKPKFYQYWRKYPGTYQDDLKITVNGRDTYFYGYADPCGKPVTGGTVYENFDMIEGYYGEQTFWFGYSYNN